ncbi:MAG: C40 family peptidase [Propionibacteriales bacterium]|nr:C40 family peptidase [Propionibacteriales bacterium]
MSTLSRAGARLLVLPLAASLLVLAPSQAAPAAAADKALAPAPGRFVTDAPQTVASRTVLPVGERAVRAARTRAGSPYVYGAAGPTRFDCSGLVQWSFRKVGKRLPRTSGAQVSATRRVAHPRRGDLVFFTNGGRVYHVGIYAGDHMLWHASRPGTPVRKDRIWTSSVFYGRVR